MRPFVSRLMYDVMRQMATGSLRPPCHHAAGFEECFDVDELLDTAACRLEQLLASARLLRSSSPVPRESIEDFMADLFPAYSESHVGQVLGMVGRELASDGCKESTTAEVLHRLSDGAHGRIAQPPAISDIVPSARPARPSQPSRTIAVPKAKLRFTDNLRMEYFCDETGRVRWQSPSHLRDRKMSRGCGGRPPLMVTCRHRVDVFDDKIIFVHLPASVTLGSLSPSSGLVELWPGHRYEHPADTLVDVNFANEDLAGVTELELVLIKKKADNDENKGGSSTAAAGVVPASTPPSSSSPLHVVEVRSITQPADLYIVYPEYTSVCIRAKIQPSAVPTLLSAVPLSRVDLRLTYVSRVVSTRLW